MKQKHAAMLVTGLAAASLELSVLMAADGRALAAACFAAPVPGLVVAAAKAGGKDGAEDEADIAEAEGGAE